MEKNKFAVIYGLKENLKAKFGISGGKDSRAWIFYGWTATVALSLFIFGYTIFFLNNTVYLTLKNVDVIFLLKETAIYNEINMNLFEKVSEKWNAKKALGPVKINIDPFF